MRSSSLERCGVWHIRISSGRSAVRQLKLCACATDGTSKVTTSIKAKRDKDMTTLRGVFTIVFRMMFSIVFD
jgi:hypothetical protein